MVPAMQVNWTMRENRGRRSDMVCVRGGAGVGAVGRQTTLSPASRVRMRAMTFSRSARAAATSAEVRLLPARQLSAT